MKQKNKCHIFKVGLELSLRTLKMSEYQDLMELSDNKLWGIK